MASKVLYVCDWCKSYIKTDGKGMPGTYTMKISIERNSPTQENPVQYSERRRELCLNCTTLFAETLLLEKYHTSDDLFKDFNIDKSFNPATYKEE